MFKIKNPVAHNGQTLLLLAAKVGYFDIYKLIICETRAKGKTPPRTQGKRQLHIFAV